MERRPTWTPSQLAHAEETAARAPSSVESDRV
jgi:hypothetical protein